MVGGAGQGSADCRRKPHPSFAKLAIGERQEHLDAFVSFAGAGQRRRLFPGLDILTIKWVTGDLPEECRFLLNTHLVFLKKEKDPTSKQFDGGEWIRSLAEAQEDTTDIPEDGVTFDQQDVDPKKVRPIQMGEFLRKYVSWRLLALSEGEISALTTSMRQIGVGTPGGAEALAIFHQLICDECMTGSLSGPLARRKKLLWDDRMEGGARGGVAVSPKHRAAAAWKHRNVSFVEQEGLSPMVKDSLALGMVAAEARGGITARQAAGTLPWIGVNDSWEEQRLQADHAARVQESANFQLGGAEKLTCALVPRHALPAEETAQMSAPDHPQSGFSAGKSPEGSSTRIHWPTTCPKSGTSTARTMRRTTAAPSESLWRGSRWMSSFSSTSLP